MAPQAPKPTTTPAAKPSVTEAFTAGLRNAFSKTSMEEALGISAPSDAKKAPRVAGGETSIEPSISGLAKGMELTNSILGQINSTMAISNDILTQQLAVQKKSNTYLKDILDEIKKGIGSGSGPGGGIPNVPLPDKPGGKPPGGSTGPKPGGGAPAPKGPGGARLPAGAGAAGARGLFGRALGAAGRIATPVGATLEAVDEYQQSGSIGRAAGVGGGALAGAWAGAKLGAAAGMLGGPAAWLTAPIGAVVGGTAGMVGGAWAARQAMGTSAPSAGATQNAPSGSAPASNNTGGKPSVKSIAQYIYAKAKAMGVDPNMALGIAVREGLNPNTIGSSTFGNRDRRGYSFGPYQLFSGSPDPNVIAQGGMAAEFMKKYGEAPNASNWQKQVDFALDLMKKRGPGGLEKGPWYAVRDNGGIASITRIGAQYAQQHGLTNATLESASQVSSSGAPSTGTNQAGETSNAQPAAAGDSSGGASMMQQALSALGIGGSSQQQTPTSGSPSLPATPSGIAGGGQQSYTNRQESPGGQQAGQQSSGNLNFGSGVNQSIQNGIKQKVSQIEAAFGSKLTITSGYRDPARNKKVGGAKNSAHMRGNAVDISFGGGIPATLKLIETASKAGIGGIGVYGPGSVHLDTENRRAWGPTFARGSVPGWAEAAIRAHETGKWGEYDASAKGGGANAAGAEGGQQGGKSGGGAAGAAGAPEGGGAEAINKALGALGVKGFAGGGAPGALAAGAGTRPGTGATGAQASGAGKISKDDVKAAWERYNESGNPADFVRADALMKQYQSQGGDATPQREAARQSGRAGGRTGGRAGASRVPLPPQRPTGIDRVSPDVKFDLEKQEYERVKKEEDRRMTEQVSGATALSVAEGEGLRQPFFKGSDVTQWEQERGINRTAPDDPLIQRLQRENEQQAFGARLQEISPKIPQQPNPYAGLSSPNQIQEPSMMNMGSQMQNPTQQMQMPDRSSSLPDSVDFAFAGSILSRKPSSGDVSASAGMAGMSGSRNE